MTITPEVVQAHQLAPDEYERILKTLGREPTLTELGIFGVMWSEHCSYKSTRVHLKKLPTAGRYVLQGPGENAGIIDIGGGYAVAFKIESHNHPSFIEPFQGAATGVGGILRDIFTMGARPLAVLNSLRFGPPRGPNGRRNSHLIDGVVSGIAHYGNCFGVPTLGGECAFDPSYDGNPLVNVFALGVFRHDEIFYGKASGVGNPVIYVGARTGRDGIHGASMASAEFTEDAKQRRPNVQVGDPFLEKLLLEACLEAMKTGAIVGIQDMGAAGLTSSSCEMGSRAGTGIDLDLDRVPQRETGMTAYEMMLSESQERMLLVAQAGREGEIFEVFHKWGLEAVTVGAVTGDGRLRVRHHGQLEADIPNPALADEAPRYHRPCATPLRPNVRPRDGGPPDPALALTRLLGSPDLCSKRFIAEQYDSQVQTNTVAGSGFDAAVIRVKDTDTCIAVALDGNGRFCALDARAGTKLIVAECYRNLSTAGALPVATTNNLNFGNPERPEIMAQIVESVEGLAEACRFFEVPVTGGNVSLYNETLGAAILPTPVVGLVGLLSARRPPTSTFTAAGQTVLLLGGLGEPNEEEMGGTQWAKLRDALYGRPPKLDMERERRVCAVARELAREGLCSSAHDIADGGLAIALAEMCFGPERVGVHVEVDSALPIHQLLFHEGPSRILVAGADPVPILEKAAEQNVECMKIGVTLESVLHLDANGIRVLTYPVDQLFGVWDGALENALSSESHATY